MIKKLFLNDTFIFFLILINAVLLFMQCYRESPWLLRLDSGLMVCFIIEMVVKLRHFGWCEYWKDRWNRFDGIITIFSSFSLLHFLLAASGGPLPLGVLIAFRIFRIFRFFRILRFLPAMDSMVNGTKRAIDSSYVILLAFGVITFIVSLVSCSFYRNISPEYFGNPLRSCYTIFRLFTIEGWYEIPNSVASACQVGFWGALTKVYFTVLLFTGGIIGMSFINSIIVDAMVSDNNDELIKKMDNLEAKIDHLTTLLSERGVTVSDETEEIRATSILEDFSQKS